jgi:tetratricopeptide (TPR) repeat protein
VFATRGAAEEQSWARAYLLLAEATLAVARRERSQAVEWYEEAISLLEHLELQIDLSQARVSYGRDLRELGDLGGARKQLEQAREACVAMGATGLAAEAERELALVGSASLR